MIGRAKNLLVDFRHCGTPHDDHRSTQSGPPAQKVHLCASDMAGGEHGHVCAIHDTVGEPDGSVNDDLADLGCEADRSDLLGGQPLQNGAGQFESERLFDCFHVARLAGSSDGNDSWLMEKPGERNRHV